MCNYAVLTAFLFEHRQINEDNEITRAEGLKLLVGLGMNQLKLGMYQINATGGSGMATPCDKSILTQHIFCSQEEVCKVGGGKLVKDNSIS